MFQRLIGCGLGAIVSYVILYVMSPGIPDGDPNPGYLTAVVAGAVVSFLWPWLIGWFWIQRRKGRRDAQIEKEVERQMADKS